MGKLPRKILSQVRRKPKFYRKMFKNSSELENPVTRLCPMFIRKLILVKHDDLEPTLIKNVGPALSFFPQLVGGREYSSTRHVTGKSAEPFWRTETANVSQLEVSERGLICKR